MLEELDQNTLRFPEQFEELWYESDGSDGGHVEWDGYIDERDEKGRPLNKPKYTAPTTILRKPATAAQIAEALAVCLGRMLPVYIEVPADMAEAQMVTPQFSVEPNLLRLRQFEEANASIHDRSCY